MSTNIEEKIYQKFYRVVKDNALFKKIERFIVLFSCGKDCSMLLDLFLRYIGDEFEISPEVKIFSVMYPKHMYIDGNEQLTSNTKEIQEYWKNRGVDIEYILPETTDFDDEDKYGCKVCKKVRKSIIDPYVNSQCENTGILTGFTMYDALSYLNMILLTCNYDLATLNDLPEPTHSITTKMLHKMSLRENLPNGKSMIRPVLPFDEQDVCEYLESKKIPYLNIPCKISKYKFKRQYSNALQLYDRLPVSYKGIDDFLSQYNISLNNNGLSFDDVVDDNYFIDC